VPARRLIVLLCLTGATTTVSIGAFPALLPEIGTATGLVDWELGAVAGAFGLARMVANVPVGLFITHHLSRALVLSPGIMLLGAVLLASGGSFGMLLLGRGLMGLGHTLFMLGSLTTILRYCAGPGLASSLNAVELSAMVGVLSGAALLSILPGAVPWNAAVLLSCAPVVANVGLLAAVRRALPGPAFDGPRPLFARSQEPARTEGGADDAGRSAGALTVMAVVAGAAVAVSYATIEQFVLPLRGSREFGLDRAGIARLLMLAQAVDAAALLPLGALADRRGTPRVLGAVLVVFALALALIGFGTLPMMALGCVLFGFSMAGWMLPLGLLRSVTPPARVAWRTALYRVSVDGGMFAGPFVSGLLTVRYAGLVPAVMLVVLAVVGLLLLSRRRLTAPSP
jgi:MFS transporter, DHA1 family, tetracycline resistance protein